ncbi:hypothetical protein [Rhodanobacter thiooxydans]|uniref:hypothetical protein n=1 Tax=Rhodanobacter thiooxydans TaxID=416169 RepID=UPI00131EFC0A|nr:hypothetical protein [Rhodanobacter thiooxydans]
MQALMLSHPYGTTLTVPAFMPATQARNYSGKQDGGPQVFWSPVPYDTPLPTDTPLAVVFWDPAHAEDVNHVCNRVPVKTLIIVVAPHGQAALLRSTNLPVTVLTWNADVRVLLQRLFAALLVPGLHEGAIGMDVADLLYALEQGGTGHLLEVRGHTFTQVAQSLLRQVRRRLKHRAFAGLVLHIAAPVGSVRFPPMMDGLLRRLHRLTSEGNVIVALTVSVCSTISMHALMLIPDEINEIPT